MAGAEAAGMSDRRPLMTEREREIISGEADDVSDSYRYQTVSRIRSRMQGVADDLEALEAHGELADELLELLGIPPERRHLEERALERWGGEYRIEVSHWADGDSDVYAYHNEGRNEDGLRVRQKMGLYDGEIGIVRQYLEPDCVVREETLREPHAEGG